MGLSVYVPGTFPPLSSVYLRSRLPSTPPAGSLIMTNSVWRPWMCWRALRFSIINPVQILSQHSDTTGARVHQEAAWLNPAGTPVRSLPLSLKWPRPVLGSGPAGPWTPGALPQGSY